MADKATLKSTTTSRALEAQRMSKHEVIAEQYGKDSPNKSNKQSLQAGENDALN